MPNKRKYLEGELRYAEGLTSADDFLKSIASELVKKDWVDYKNSRWNALWTFNENREITLNDSFMKENIRLFKSLATTEIAPSGIAYGVLKVLTGVNTSFAETLNITLNSETYGVSLQIGDTPEEVAGKVVEVIRLIEGFEATRVDEHDSRSVIITGAVPVFILDVDTAVEKFASTEIVTSSKVSNGIATGRIVVLSDALGSGEFDVTVNGETVTISISTETDNMIASKIAAAIRAMGMDFADTISNGNVVTVAGEVEVVSVDVSADTGRDVTNTITTLLPVGYGTIEVLSEARMDGSIKIVVDNTERYIDVVQGDSPVAIAQKIQDRVSDIIGYTKTSVLNNIVTVSGDTTLVLLEMPDTDVEERPIIYVGNEVTSAYDIGFIEVLTPSTKNQLLEVFVNGLSYEIAVTPGDSTIAIAQKINSVIKANSPFDMTTYEGNIVRVTSSNQAVYSISTNGEIGDDRAYMIPSIETGALNMGTITMIQGVEEDSTITVTINDGNHVVSVLATDTLSEIAEKIGNVLSNVSGFLETTVLDNTVSILGTESVNYINVSAAEIPEEYFEIYDNVVKGIGDSSNGTAIGDNVLIKVIYAGEEFQRLPFLKETTPSGSVEMIARLKSRPKGDIELFEDTISVITDDILENRGEGLYYKFGKSPISQSKGTHKLVLKRDGADIPEEEYEVDYFNGAVFFHKANSPDEVISADYGVCTGVAGEPVSSDKYKIINDMIIDTTETSELENLDVIVLANYFWEIVHPATIEGITLSTERIVLRTRIDITTAKNKSSKKNYYWEIRHNPNIKNEYLTGLECRYGASLDGSGTTLDNNTSSVWSRLSWYESDSSQMTEESHVDGWLPVHYQMNFTQEYLNLIVQGSPSVDSSPYDKYLISHLYIGALEEYEDRKMDDIQYNFGMTVGGDVTYEDGEFPRDWGQRTGTCKTDITMERTGDGIPFQAHYPSFHTTPEFMDKHFISASEYTGSHHFSEIIVTHPVQRERGKMQGVIVGDRSSIHHLDELISNKDEFNPSGILLNKKKKHYNDCGGANISKEKKWVSFNINSPYWFMNNSPNVFYGLALRKS